MSVVELFQQAESKVDFLSTIINARSRELGLLFQHLVSVKDEESIDLLVTQMELGPRIVTLENQFKITLEFIAMVRHSNNVKLFTKVLKIMYRGLGLELVNLAYQWFIETRNSDILKIVFKRFSHECSYWLQDRCCEILNYAIEWSDGPLLRYCGFFLTLNVPILELMIEKAPRELEIFIVAWMADFNTEIPIDVVDCLIKKYRGSNKKHILADICQQSEYNVDIVRRVADNAPKALSYIADWSAKPGCRQVCDLFMFHRYGHKLSPVRLIKSDPEYLRDYQREIRLVEFVKQVCNQTVGIRNRRCVRVYRLHKRFRLCQMVGFKINIGDLVRNLGGFVPRCLSGDPDGILETERTKAAFADYIRAQTEEYRNDFRESLELYRKMFAGKGRKLDWVDV